jgi:hypothetical protein
MSMQTYYMISDHNDRLEGFERIMRRREGSRSRAARILHRKQEPSIR